VPIIVMTSGADPGMRSATERERLRVLLLEKPFGSGRLINLIQMSLSL